MLTIRIRNFKDLYFAMLLVFGLALIDKTWSCEETCVNINGKIICYFEVWDFKVDWDTAWQLCSSRNSTLPVIRYRDEQDVFAKFLNTHIMSGSAVWTSGKNHTYDYWTWVDGREFDYARDGLLLWSYEERYQSSFARGTPDGLLIGDVVNPRQFYHYTCQYSGSLCHHFTDAIEVRNGCIRHSDTKRSWYDARNQCLITGGDLDVLEYNDRHTINDYLSPTDRWIGLRRTSWRWNLHQQASTEEDDIKYTNWSDDWNPLTGNCISIDTSNGKWKAIRCSERLKVVCQRDFVNSTSPRPYRSTASESVEQESQFVSYAAIISVVFAGICVIIIANVIVALVARKYLYHKTNCKNTCTTNRCYYELDLTLTRTNSDETYVELPMLPVYEEVHDNVYI